MEMTADFFGYFSGQSRLAIWRAHEEALKWKHDCVSTEHLIVGLLRDDANFVAGAMREQSLSRDEMLTVFDGRLAWVESHSSLSIMLTPRAGRTLLAAIDLALEMNQARASSTHIFLAMLNDSDNSVRQCLEEHGFDRYQAEASIRSAPPEPNRDFSVHSPQSDSEIRTTDPTPEELAKLFAAPKQSASPPVVAWRISARESMAKFGLAIRDPAKFIRGDSPPDADADEVALPEKSFRLTSNFSPLVTLAILFGGIFFIGAMVSIFSVVWHRR